MFLRFWSVFAAIVAASRRTAVWVALVAAVVAVGWVRGQFRELLPWTVEGFLAATAFFFAFLFAWGVGLVGAGIGWMAGRRRGWPEAGARAGTIGLWLGVGAPLWAGLTTGGSGPGGRPIGSDWPAPVLAALFVLPPSLAWAMAGLAPPLAARLASWAHGHRDRFTHWFSHRLLIRTGTRRQESSSRRESASSLPSDLDLRGVAVGAVAGLIAMGLASVGAFNYLEAVSLAGRMRLRNEAVITPFGSVEWARFVSLMARGVPPSRETAIVLLEIDDATQSRIASETSELGVQRQVLERLKRWGAARAVLPVAGSAPAAEEEFLRPLVTRRPPLGPGGFQRLRRDVGPLERTIREWDRVLLFVLPETFGWRRRQGGPARAASGHPARAASGHPDIAGPEQLPRRQSERRGERPPPSREPGGPGPRMGGERLPGLVERLMRAAPAVGSADFGVYHVRQLPLLRPVDSEGRPSVPLWLAERPTPESGGQAPAERSTPRASGVRPPASGSDSDPLIVNVFGSAPGALFTRVSVTAVLEERPIYDRVRDRWVPPRQFFQDRIVFLDTLGQPRHDTPIGQSSTTELLAMATDNLQTNNRLLPPPRGWEFSLMLVVGALVGSLSIRRSPLRVFQRLLVVMGSYAVTAVGLFVYPGLWAPIVSVQCTALLAALLVLQFVFTADEHELEDARAARLRLDQELAIGREIQTSLLPGGGSNRFPLAPGPRLPAPSEDGRLPPHVTEAMALAGSREPGPGSRLYVAQHGAFDIVGWSEPAREVGGDFYDVFALEKGRLGLALGDVSGKGVPGALFMAVTMTLLQSHAHLFTEPHDVLARTNEALYPRMRGDTRTRGVPRTGHQVFVTAFYGILDVEEGRLCYASAGQTPPILVSADGPARYLPARGVPLGALRPSRYDRHEVTLGPGDRIVLASDGFVETPVRGGAAAAPLGYERFMELVAGHAHLDPPAHAAQILAGFRSRLVDPEERDDLTLLIIARRVREG